MFAPTVPEASVGEVLGLLHSQAEPVIAHKAQARHLVTGNPSNNDWVYFYNRNVVIGGATKRTSSGVVSAAYEQLKKELCGEMEPVISSKTADEGTGKVQTSDYPSLADNKVLIREKRTISLGGVVNRVDISIVYLKPSRSLPDVLNFLKLRLRAT